MEKDRQEKNNIYVRKRKKITEPLLHSCLIATTQTFPHMFSLMLQKQTDPTVLYLCQVVGQLCTAETCQKSSFQLAHDL